VTDHTAALPRASGSVRAARELVAIHGVGLSVRQLDDAGLMASELVTNALRHGRGAITIQITSGLDDVTVEVADEGHGDVAIAPASGASGGWGLRLVDSLADAWGARRGRTRVWFCILLEDRSAQRGGGPGTLRSTSVAYAPSAQPSRALPPFQPAMDTRFTG
jgi:anti-sigma regulatory factor (Ser/Thr protein kinase)